MNGFKGVQSCRRQLGAIAAVRDSKAPATITVLLEDTAATMGLLVGFLVICLGQILHKLVLNGAAPVVINITLASVSLFLAIECKGLLVGESAKPLWFVVFVPWRMRGMGFLASMSFGPCT